MKPFHQSVTAALLISLTACSTGVAVVSPPPTARLPAELEAAAFPPTWTPTTAPTEHSATATTRPSGPAGLSLSDATPVSATLPSEDWLRAEAATAWFLLPASFEVLDLGTEFGAMMAALMTGLMEGMMDLAFGLGEELGAPAPQITPTPLAPEEVAEALAIDFVLAMQSDEMTSAFLFGEPRQTPTTLEEQVQALLDEQENPVEIVALSRVSGYPQERARLQLIATDAETGERGGLLIYLILTEARVYQLGFGTPLERFEELLPVFETSAASFTLISP